MSPRDAELFLAGWLEHCAELLRKEEPPNRAPTVEAMRKCLHKLRADLSVIEEELLSRMTDRP